jgi:S-adenosylmethionine decarboxylase
MQYWGKHLVADVKACNISRATDPEYIRWFTKELVRMIEMVPHGEPQVVHFADGTDLAGWTVIQLIETSSIMGHFIDMNGDLYLDIFSCKNFEGQVVIDLLNSCFAPEDIKWHVIYRNARK